MKIPYGVADFYSLRTEGQIYVDRTDGIRTFEELWRGKRPLERTLFGPWCRVSRPVDSGRPGASQEL